MKTLCILPVVCALLLAAGTAVAPAAAFQAEDLQIRVLENGDADVRFVYSLSWFDTVFVFLRIVDPARQLEQELETYSGKEVVVQSVTDNSATLRILDYASVHEEDGKKTYKTPSLVFREAGQIAQKYWWANFIAADFRPATTLVTFPDGHEEFFQDAPAIPVITRTIL